MRSGGKLRPLPRLSSALSPAPPGLFISSARGRTEKASVPPVLGRCSAAPRTPRPSPRPPSPSPCSPARPPPRPSPAQPPWSAGLGRRAVPGCLWRPALCCSCCAQTCVWAARCWRRWRCWLRSTGCASACCPRRPHSPCWPPPAGSRCPAWRARRACPWPLARCSSPVSARSAGTPGSRAGPDPQRAPLEHAKARRDPSAGVGVSPFLGCRE